MFTHLFLSGAVVITVLGSSSAAFAEKKLSKNMIEEFYKESAKMQMKSERELIPFLEKHMSDDIVADMKTIIKIQGAPTQEDHTVLNKEEIIKYTVEGLEAGEIHSVEEKLMAADIAPDGRSASTKDSLYSEMTVTVPTPQGEMKFLSETAVFCSDELKLNEKDIIQITKSNCSNEVTMKPQE